MKPVLPSSATRWVDPPESPLPGELTTMLNLPELVLRILQRQGMHSSADAHAFMDYHAYSPASPYELDDMDKGIERTLRAVMGGELIGVWGDFDVDGQTATATLVSALRTVGAKVVYHVPVRGPESHGIKLDVLQKFVKQGITLLITCDTGISEVDQVAWTQTQGIDVIITDHHTLPEALPQAYAVINPQRLAADHPLRPLPGVGVACKFAEALLGRFNQAEEARSLHDLAALGIIADIADLHADSRYLAQSGIDVIRQSARPSLRAMLQAAEIEAAQFSEESISFALAPRMNAVGRLADANPMVEFLLSDNPAVISVTVNQLEGLNAQRKLLCDQVFQGALAQIERNPALLDHPVLILSHPEWPAGVVGIVASRLISLFHRPVILMVAPPGGLMRGSARSIEGIDITSAIRQNSSFLASFGGHPMAAGLALDPQNFKSFQRELDKTIEQQSEHHPVVNELQIDVWQQPAQIDLSLLQSIDQLAPFGAGNPPIVMAAKKMKLVNATPIGKTKEHMQLLIEDAQGQASKFLWWQSAGLPQPEGLFDLAFTARASTYKGQAQVQLEWLNFRPVETESLTLSSKKRKNIEHLDYRRSSVSNAALSEIISKYQPEVFAEGLETSTIERKNRLELSPSESLIILTLPPSQAILDEIMQKVQPQRVFWFCSQQPENETEMVLKTTAQIIKQGFEQNQFKFILAEIAAALATTQEIVRLTILWMSARGLVTIQEDDAKSISLSQGGIANPSQQENFKKKIQKSMAETQAFRRYAIRSDLSDLVEHS
jgi:single-stranded-DNA-specific exonuclease